MRMKLNKPIQLLAISAASLLAASFLSACATLTVDFVYVTSAKAAGPNNYGEVDVYEINSESGRMRQIITSPFPSGGRNPVAAAVSPDQADLYVVNEDDNSIVQFIIGSDGKLYPQNTLNTPGIFPLATAVSGGFLYVVDTYQPLPTCSPASPCSGSVAVFPWRKNTTRANENSSRIYPHSSRSSRPIDSCGRISHIVSHNCRWQVHAGSQQWRNACQHQRDRPRRSQRTKPYSRARRLARAHTHQSR